jgi:hypothetical protein
MLARAAAAAGVDAGAGEGLRGLGGLGWVAGGCGESAQSKCPGLQRCNVSLGAR